MALSRACAPLTDFEPTSYGFRWGPANVERLASDDKKGWVLMAIQSAKSRIQVYVTKTGKIRVLDLLLDTDVVAGQFKDAK